MSCRMPIAHETLVDYVTRELAAPDADALEAHVFECEACAGRLNAIARLGASVATVARAAVMRMPATGALVEQMARDGLKLRHYELAAGATVRCTVAADDDYVVSWLAADFAPDEPVDLVSLIGGQEVARIDDYPVDRKSGSAVFVVPGDELRTYPDMVIHLRLEQGTGAATRVLGDYTFDHARYRPG